MPTIEGKLGLVFPGQGSQVVGMGTALRAASPAAAAALQEADDVLGIDLSGLIQNGPPETLEDTINAQPAILAVSVAAHRAVQERLAQRDEKLTPVMVAGHSLGEFSALVATGAMAYPAALALVRERGRLMKEAGEKRPGGMAAVLGLDGVVVMANQNCPGQTVISGEVAALEAAMELAKVRGAKRVTRLGVSIASHSPLMAAANKQFQKLVAATTIVNPSCPVVGNSTALPLGSAVAIRDELGRQMQAAVLWTDSVRTMVDAGVTTFLELGPGTTLAGLIKRIARDVPTHSVADLGLDLPGTTT
jgi:[acyl-carrier-protein] S-malonyltransferase